LKALRNERAQKLKNLEATKRKLLELRRKNETLKVEDMVTAFFLQRDREEVLLNKIDLLGALSRFMVAQKEENDFALEEDLKSLPVYQDLVARYHQLISFEQVREGKHFESLIKKKSSKLSEDQELALEKKSTVLTVTISSRWDESKRIKIDEKGIEKGFEEVMVKNKLLNVTFDNLMQEKSKRVGILEGLQG